MVRFPPEELHDTHTTLAAVARLEELIQVWPERSIAGQSGGPRWGKGWIHHC